MTEVELPLMSVVINVEKRIFHTKFNELHVGALSDELLAHLNKSILPHFKAKVEKEIARRDADNFLKKYKGELKHG